MCVSVCVGMYVCMYVCMCVCVCVYVCMYVCIHKYVCMYVCIYVYIYNYIIYVCGYVYCYCRFSGLTAKDFNNINTTLINIHKQLMNIIYNDTILIGHSLESDLKAMKVKLNNSFINCVL